ncbi:Gdt1 family [Dillenia turbinata]|uniref:GDT1 family protein n=1 Tax=Dillenia turbinata TaxID=194707 RepID=A0AAN8Z7N7_9MAGN
MCGLTKSLAMTVLSEIGDRTFCVAAILAMRHPRKSVFLGCLSSTVVMTILSALVGWAAPNMISPKWAHHMTTFLYFAFGLKSLWEGFNEDDDDNEELKQVVKELDANTEAKSKGKEKAKTDEDSKKQRRPFLTHLFSPVFLKAFSLTFFGEWGDKSQLATIGLAAEENTLGVVVGGVIGQALCTIAAVIGGKTLASRISERLVTCFSTNLFKCFSIPNFVQLMPVTYTSPLFGFVAVLDLTAAPRQNVRGINENLSITWNINLGNLILGICTAECRHQRLIARVSGSSACCGAGSGSTGAVAAVAGPIFSVINPSMKNEEIQQLG